MPVSTLVITASKECIEAERARRRSLANLRQFQDTEVENFPPRGKQGKTRDIVAQSIGLGSGKQWDKLGTQR